MFRVGACTDEDGMAGYGLRGSDRGGNGVVVEGGVEVVDGGDPYGVLRRLPR